MYKFASTSLTYPTLSLISAPSSSQSKIMQTVVIVLKTFKLPISIMKRESSVTNSGTRHYAHDKQYLEKAAHRSIKGIKQVD